MNVTCPQCNARMNLPDHKIPKGRDASFKCPKCQGSIKIKAGAHGSEPARKPVAGQDAAPGDRSRPQQSFSGTAAGAHQALVCMADSPGKTCILEAVQRAGYLPEAPLTPAQAFAKLEYHLFGMVILDDAFDPDQEMSAHMIDMDMSLRRRICLVKISPEVATGDGMAALRTSVNAVVNSRDLEDANALDEILARALTDHQNLYTVFMESMQAIGRI